MNRHATSRFAAQPGQVTLQILFLRARYVHFNMHSGLHFQQPVAGWNNILVLGVKGDVPSFLTISRGSINRAVAAYRHIFSIPIPQNRRVDTPMNSLKNVISAI
jgi:hypothetical protein